MRYYNENDPKAAAWLRELMKQGHIPEGEVDERSIRDIDPRELAGFVQCHFFAGIGGWPFALRLAGWPDDAPVWTGSCPCQPFSIAGRGLGIDDPRHLWPAWLRLIAICRPPTLFGEQVASPAGRLWLSGVFADLEALGSGPQQGQQATASARHGATPNGRQHEPPFAGSDGTRTQSPESRLQSGVGCGIGPWSDYAVAHFTDGKSRRIEPGTFPLAHGVPARVVRLRGYGNAIVPKLAAEFVMACMDLSL